MGGWSRRTHHDDTVHDGGGAIGTRQSGYERARNQLGNAQKLSGELKQITFNATMPTMTLAVVAYRSKARPGEVRAESITVAKRTFDLR